MAAEFEQMISRIVQRELDKHIRAEKEHIACEHVAKTISTIVSEHMPFLPLSKARKTKAITMFNDFIETLVQSRLGLQGERNANQEN